MPEKISPGLKILGSEKTHLVTSVSRQPEGVRRRPVYGIGPTSHEREADAIGLIDNAIVGSVTRVSEKPRPIKSSSQSDYKVLRRYILLQH